jgi:cell division protein FtsI/penicillin-binding protein 2
MNLSSKVNRVLGIFLFCFFTIILKVWNLSVIQREEKLIESHKPQERTVLIPADRGTIYDRFYIPMATNRISYNAAIYYNQIAQIPSVSWRTDHLGKQTKVYTRKEYIRTLSEGLATVLDLEPKRLEDLIHSKAALFPHAPYLLKTNLTEEEHYRLRMMEKDFPGVYAEITSTRVYPLGKVGCNILGYLGAINQKEYSSIAQEISELQMDDEESPRLLELKEKAYSINDLVGKSGIEAQFEESLRGFFGKKTFEVDQKGCFVREIRRKEATPGEEVRLTISSELQQFAENLLSQNEKTRDGRSLGVDPTDGVRKIQKQPWIKGGAIVALDPNTGEILALASHPRFDPNDFISKNPSRVGRWLETTQHIGAIWDGHEPLVRERGNKEEKQMLTWEFYLDSCLQANSPIRTFFQKMDTVAGAIQLQEDYEAMLYFTKSGLTTPIDIQKRLDAIALSPQDKVFAVDLCRTLVYAPAFTDALIAQIGSMKLSTYMQLSQNFFKLEKEIREEAFQAFRLSEFQQWRDKEQKSFLKEKRKLEKERHTYARPYIDYLDQKEMEAFNLYWEEKKGELLVSKEFSLDLIRTFRPFSKLNRPLLGKYRKKQTEKDLAAAFYPPGGFGFSRSLAFEAGVPQGSIFKLVTAYEALAQGKQLTIIDEIRPQSVAFTQNRIPYPRHYKGGRLPKSAIQSIGKIDLVRAIEQSSNPYFSILAGDCLNDPEDLKKAAKLFGLGQKTGLELPREKRGNLPSDLKTNRTGLYSTAIGQHTLLTTPLQTACMMAAIGNGGKLLKPHIVQGETQVRELLPMDESIRAPLLEGMERVIWGQKGSARPSGIKELLREPLLMRDYLGLQHQMIGKTGTAELVCNFSANPTSPGQIYKYIWFGAISFPDAKRETPELVVVVFLRYGDAGKEAAPLAAQMIHKWREIQKNKNRT